MSTATKAHRLSMHSMLFQWGVFFAGMTAMAVAGFILVEGMLKFGGDAGTRSVFIAAGIIFQISETICFIACASMVRRSLHWRLGLFGLGVLLFIFSIAVMTLAQKATLFAGEQHNEAIEQQIAAIRSQVDSLDKMIASYRLNAEKQSQSIYADSRKRGQDSLNRATELEQQKLSLTDKLFELNKTKQQTSSQFFRQLQAVTGLPALETEFYFLVIRSVLLELCGIVLMAFAAYLISDSRGQKTAASVPLMTPASRPSTQLAPIEQDSPKEKHDSSWAAKYINALRQQTTPSSASDEHDAEYADLLNKVIELYRSGKLTSLNVEAIIAVLNEQLSEPVQPDTAQVIQQLAKKHLQL